MRPITKRLEAQDAVVLLSALAQPTRLAAFRLLMRYRPHGLSAGHIARLLAVPQNTLSSHLALLERAGLVASRRESRNMIYAAAADCADALLAFLADACCSERPLACAPQMPIAFPSRSDVKMTGKPFQILVLCTGNSARSILAEAIFNREGTGRIKVWSAGSKPSGVPNPFAVLLLEDLGYDTSEFRSKSWDEFSGPDATRLDLAITVCDAAAGESCPLFAGAPIKAHWALKTPPSLPDLRRQRAPPLCAPTAN
jgi:ArsR family transcriptional regulator, arsenate/arsenite/antimonite-responsive transcriptional repressor / arsenate reductase (thioredoxin)